MRFRRKRDPKPVKRGWPLPKPKQAGTKWDYCLVWNESEEMLRAYGAQGWELVAVTGIGSIGNPTRCIFKRER